MLVCPGFERSWFGESVFRSSLNASVVWLCSAFIEEDLASVFIMEDVTEALK